MKLSAQEKLMYSVMKAVYDSGIPMSFKGSMVLKACLVSEGYTEDIRHTVDIDANWNTAEYPTTEQIAESLQTAISRSGIHLKVIPYRKYGEGRSAGFELADTATDEVLFTMDVDVNRPKVLTQIYQISDIQFSGTAPMQMIADKVTVVSSDKIFRRVKDVIDLYYLSHVFVFDREQILAAITESGRELGAFSAFLDNREELKHAYNKFRFTGGVNKPQFEDVYETVKAYISGTPGGRE